jgi:hypothetical protein
MNDMMRQHASQHQSNFCSVYHGVPNVLVRSARDVNARMHQLGCNNAARYIRCSGWRSRRLASGCCAARWFHRHFVQKRGEITPAITRCATDCSWRSCGAQSVAAACDATKELDTPSRQSKTKCRCDVRVQQQKNTLVTVNLRMFFLIRAASTATRTS